MAKEVVLISIHGDDKPRVTASITEILGRYNSKILDAGQADIHHKLSLGFLVQIDDSSQTGAIFKDILFKCYEMDVQVHFTPISMEEYADWVDRQGKGHYVVTMLGHVITARQMALVTKAVADQELNIDSIKRLSGRPTLMMTMSMNAHVSNYHLVGICVIRRNSHRGSWRFLHKKMSIFRSKKMTCTVATAD